LFCFYFKLVYIPAATETLQLYAQFLSRTFKSVEAIKNYISGIKTMHQLLGVDISHINTFLLNLSFKGLSKYLLHAVTRAEPITPQILAQIYTKLDFSRDEDVTYWCLFLFAFFLLARKSNLVPTYKRDLRQPKFLLRKDIQVFEHSLLINMKWSKTIQSGERILQTLLTYIPGSILCPVLAYHNMIKRIPAESNSPLFLFGNNKPIFYNQYLAKLGKLFNAVNMDGSKFSTHSFRRGFATLAFRLNLPADLIQLMGDWHSDAYKNYIQYSLADKTRISKYVSLSIQALNLTNPNP
jgi:integrase